MMDITGIEKACCEIIDDNINMTVPWYLMAAYAYYEEDNPIITDQMFDHISKKMLKHWDEIEHMHKSLITPDMLYAGTYIGTYPSRVKGAVDEVRTTYR